MEKALVLQPMRSLQEAQDEDDNWTGLVDAKARRRLQNRLNKRASRRRKEQTLASRNVAMSANPHDAPVVTIRPPTASPPHPFSLPLSVDYLLTLVQFNVYRALYTNMAVLGSPIVSVTSCEIPEIMTTPLPLPKAFPPALMPTNLQLSVPHLSWIDIVPLPRMRDNLIQQWDTYDSCELCDDLLGTLWDEEPSKHDERMGIVCWGDPWDINSWEFMEGFLRKWQRLLIGCEEILVATDRWRVVRGEKPIRVREITELP